MRPIIAFFVLSLAASLAVPGAAVARGPEPAAVTAARRDLGAACRRAGGTPSFGPGFLRLANVTPDGRPDYILATAAVGCSEPIATDCGSGGCGHLVIVSVGGRHRQVGEITARHLRVQRGVDRDSLVVTLHDASCPPNAPACEKALTWNGTRLVRSRPNPRRGS